jgi:DNA polymerase I-like protein with 3'-5' exonuclease and polymerase domains
VQRAPRAQAASRQELGQASTEADTLEALVDAHPVVRPILDHRELMKLKGTYLDALPPLVNARTGRVHTTFNQVVAETDRISSQDPNLQFMEDIVTLARAQGGERTLLGRWRPIPNLLSKSPQARHAAERVAQNTPMQGAGADIIKLAMLATAARIAREGWPVKMLLTVHDELVFEAPPDIAEAVGAALKAEMEGVYQLSVPLEVDIGIADN